MIQFGTMAEWFIFLRGAGLGLLVALMVAIAVRFHQQYALRVLGLFALTVAAYVVAPLIYGKSQWFLPISLISDSVPLFFLLFVQALFDEHRAPSRWSLAVGALYILLGHIDAWFPHLGLVTDEISALRLASRVVIIVMLTYGLYRTVRSWRIDLVEPRRRLRVAVAAIVGAYILGVVVIESAASLLVPAWVEVAHSAGIVASTLLFLAVAVSLGPEGLLSATTDRSQTPSAPDSNPVLRRIANAMEQEQIYREMGLTIRSLGEHLQIPEHQLRRHINQELGYRNFNDFLNHYRLAEVRQRLIGEDSRQLPILTIAMDAGYRSLTTFNRAFKAKMGLTPREYREKN